MADTIKVAVAGSEGRMGSTVCAAVEAAPDMELVGRADPSAGTGLEEALAGFEGTVLAVSHDRTFLSTLDRFVMITDDGDVFALPDYEIALRALTNPESTASIRLAKSLTT